MVRISAFQAGGLGSIPGWRIFLYFSCPMAAGDVDSDVPLALISKYTFQRKIGRGTRAVVWKVASVADDNDVYAVKRIFSAFQSRAESQRTYREISLLHKLSAHSNVLQVSEIYASTNERDIFVVSEYMNSDLMAAIRSNALRPIHKELVMWQLLSALKFIHSAGVIHRAIEPQNILINNRCDVKVAGFSRARLVTSYDEEFDLTDYISSRWYKSPEQLISSKQYTTAVDMWAAGCVLAEMMTLKPLFMGTSTIAQLDLVLNFTGRPKPDEFAAFHSSASTGFLQGFGKAAAADTESALVSAPPEAQDLVRLLLQAVPDLRITATEALEHPFVNHFHNPDDEPSYTGVLELSLNCNKKYSVNTYRDFIYGEYAGNANAKIRMARFQFAADEHVKSDLQSKEV